MKTKIFNLNTTICDSVRLVDPNHQKFLALSQYTGSQKLLLNVLRRQLFWSDLEETFILKTITGTNIDISYVTVPISLLVHPLCVIPDYGGHSTSFIVVLPKCN
jgi:hypothetical protein